MVDVKFDGGGKVYFVVKPEKEVMNDVEVQKTQELPLGVTNPTKEWTRLYVKEIEYDPDGDEIPDGDFSDDEVEEEADHTEPMGSNGFDLPLLTMPGQERTQNIEHAMRQTPTAKTRKLAFEGRRSRWKDRKILARYNLKTGMVEQKGKNFEEYTVKELRKVVNSKVPELIAEPKVRRMWYDDEREGCHREEGYG